MKFKNIPILLILSLLSLYSCGGDSGGGNGNAQEEQAPGSNDIGTYDSEVTTTERDEFNQDVSRLGTLPIEGSRIKKFSQVFNGTQSPAVKEFVDTRINYVLSSTTDIESRISVSGPLSLFNAETVATNIGMALWYQAKVLEPANLEFEINNTSLPVDSGRVGIIQIGNIFPRLSTIEQISTIVHEARHSDCTGGILRSDIERLRNGQVPENKKCGHVHVICPPGHPLEGEFACDSHPWGAYAVGFLYAGTIALACDGCSEAEKTVAEAVSIDSSTRLLYDVNDLLDGRLGEPDMTNSTTER